MKRATFLMCVAAFLLLVPTGCDKPTPFVVQTVTAGTVQLGFYAWAQQNPTQAKAVAEQVSKGASTAIDYLDNNTGLATTVLDAVIQAKLTEGLPIEVQDLIITAAGVLDDVLPAPAPDQYLTAEQLAYLKAFVNGVKEGVAAYDSKAPVKELKLVQKAQKNFKPGKWLRAAKK